MAAGLYICLGIFIAVIIGLVVACDLLERRYHMKHPPDDWDGMREDRDHDDD